MSFTLGPGGVVALLLAVAALAAAALAAFLRARVQQRALDGVVATCRRLAGGDLSARLPEVGAGRTAALAVEVNRLAELLAAQEEDRRQWVADTSHELRTPLAVLRAQVEALVDGVHPADAETLGTLHDEVMRLTRLVDDLHLLARSDAGAAPCRPEGIDVVDLAHRVAASFADRCRAAGLDLGVEPEDGGEIFLDADPARLRQVLANLLENSVRYTDRGGSVRLAVHPEPRSVRVVVEDSAPGVPEEALPRLFDRFFRVERSRTRDQGGSGLGLAICRTLVEAHGGTIQAGPSAHGGLRVEVTLPREGRNPRGKR